MSPSRDALGNGAVAPGTVLPAPARNDAPLAMGNAGFMPDAYDPDTWNTAHSGTGCVTTLSMTADECAAAEKNRRPIGFVWLADGSDDGSG